MGIFQTEMPAFPNFLTGKDCTSINLKSLLNHKGHSRKKHFYFQMKVHVTGQNTQSPFGSVLQGPAGVTLF